MATCPKCGQPIDELHFYEIKDHYRREAGSFSCKGRKEIVVFRVNPEIRYYCPQCTRHIASSEEEAKKILECN